MHCVLCIKACNASNAIYVNTVDAVACGWYTTHTHTHTHTHTQISAHHFLIIQPIFNLKKVLENWELGLSHHTMNSMYVDTVNKSYDILYKI